MAPSALEAVQPARVPALRRSNGLLRRSFRFTGTRIGIAICGLLVLIAAIGPAVAPDSPTAIVGLPLQTPTADHPFGLDFLGRDVLSRFLYGGRSVILLALLATVLGSAIGVAVGLASGYHRGWLDGVLMRGSDVVMSFPAIIL